MLVDHDPIHQSNDNVIEAYQFPYKKTMGF